MTRQGENGSLFSRKKSISTIHGRADLTNDSISEKKWFRKTARFLSCPFPWTNASDVHKWMTQKTWKLKKYLKIIEFWKYYHEDLEKGEGREVVARERHESHVSTKNLPAFQDLSGMKRASFVYHKIHRLYEKTFSRNIVVFSLKIIISNKWLCSFFEAD